MIMFLLLLFTKWSINLFLITKAQQIFAKIAIPQSKIKK